VAGGDGVIRGDHRSLVLLLVLAVNLGVMMIGLAHAPFPGDVVLFGITVAVALIVAYEAIGP